MDHELHKQRTKIRVKTSEMETRYVALREHNFVIIQYKCAYWGVMKLMESN